METLTMKGETAIPDVRKILERYGVSAEAIRIIENENLLPAGLVARLQACYPQHSGFLRTDEAMFTGKTYYSGLAGFREILGILGDHGIRPDHVDEREFFIEVYRFLASRHVLNSIDWSAYQEDPLYQLVFPQPGMISYDEVKKYLDEPDPVRRKQIADDYIHKTNPHDGHQKLNKPWFVNEGGELEIVEGCQHKYPPVELVFDKSTQNCFSFCTYCFRHAQVRGDEDMFVQEDIGQVHRYLRQHKEISDFLITGGDAGYITLERLTEYIEPIIADPGLKHVKSVRLGSRSLTFLPELVLSDKYAGFLNLMRKAIDNGIQMVWVGHFSTPREIMNPATIAAIRRLKSYGVTVKSQSPIMNHISLFMDAQGKVDVDRSAQNWIDLGNIMAMLGVGFHSMYCARPTGEHHYFTAPLAAINDVFSKVFKSLVSINRPSRYITMTSSAGKISLMGTAVIDGTKVFVLKFNEGRNMDWIDSVHFALYDENETVIEKLKPYHADRHFYWDELMDIEGRLSEALHAELTKAGQND
jgi:lysine 2,3-aminomutase